MSFSRFANIAQLIKYAEETFDYVGRKYSVSEAKRLIEEGDIEKGVADLDSFKPYFPINKENGSLPFFGIRIDEKYVAQLPEDKLNEPGIWVSDEKNNFNFLIDGWHRAYARYLRGDETMEVYLISDPRDIKKITLMDAFSKDEDEEPEEDDEIGYE